MEDPSTVRKKMFDLENTLASQSSSDRDAHIEGNLENIFVQLKEARDVITYDNWPREWAWITMMLGSNSLLRKIDHSPARLRSAINYFNEALTVYQRDSYPLEHAQCHEGLGNAFRRLAVGTDWALKEQALSHYNAALGSITNEEWPELWHIIHLDLAMLYEYFAVHSSDREGSLAVAQKHLRRALELDMNKLPDLYASMISHYEAHSRLLGLYKELEVALSKADCPDNSLPGTIPADPGDLGQCPRRQTEGQV